MLAAAGGCLRAQTSLPANMGSGLRELVAAHHAGQLTGLDLHHAHLALNPRTGRTALAYGGRGHMLVDAQNRPMVRIVLDGSVPMSRVRSDLRILGLTVTAADPNWRGGILEAYLPLEQAETAARLPGVMSMHLLRAPTKHGSVTTQGAGILHSDQVNTPGVVSPNGIIGRGITIGVLSDSFNISGSTPDAFGDVSTGDLPNVGVADGRPGLKFLIDGPDMSTDEGRAVSEIAYAMAPGTSLCFATAVLGPLSFASSIRRLRTDSQCAADILVDDLTYPDEPVFSDGPIAQAVNDVATSTTLAGKRVSYFAAAGNGAGSAYASDLRMVADATARGLTGLPIDLTTVPSTIDTSGGFHNFNPDPNGTPTIAQLVTVSNSLPGDQSAFFLQWDDPFDLANGITTSLSLLVFDSTGKFLGPNPPDDAFFTQEPFQAIAVAGDIKMYFVIARTGRGSHASQKVFWSSNSPDTVTADFVDPTAPSIFGHSTAKSAIAVGAYWYDNGLVNSQFTPELESYSAAGPTTICCDASGNRLGAYEVRQKPEICGVDGVDTTFFGNLGFVSTSFSFFGTSAAAPHPAGIAALLLEAAGGPGSLTVDQVRSKLIASTGVHDLDPNFSQAVLGDNNTGVTLTAKGGEDPSNLINKKFFTLQFNSANPGQTLASLAIDISSTGLYFNTSRATGFAMAVGAASSGVQVTSAVPAGTRPTSVTLTITGLQPGGFMQFGIGRAQKTDAQNGLSADLLGGATVTATLANPAATLTGTIVNKMGTGYDPGDGWGLVDALKAIKAQ